MKTKVITAIMIVLFLASITIFAVPVKAQGTIVIDGVISSGEWDEATSYTLTPIYPDPQLPRIHTAYVTNDAEFLYVAVDYDVAIGSDVVACGVYKEGAFDPEIVNNPEVVASTAPLPDVVHALWDFVMDSDGDGVFWEGSVDYIREDPTTRHTFAVDTATEMKVPLAQLGIVPGDTAKISFYINEHPFREDIDTPSGFGTPGADITHPLTFPDYTLRIPPHYWFKASGGGVSYSDASETEDHYCTLGVIGMSLEPVIGTGNKDEVLCKGSGTFIDHDLKIKISFEIDSGSIARWSDYDIFLLGTATIFDIADHAKHYDVPVRVSLVDDAYSWSNRFDVRIWGTFPFPTHWHGTLEPESEVTVWVWED